VKIRLIVYGATFPKPVIAPCAFAYIEGTKKSANPPKTINGTVEASLCRRGYVFAKDAAGVTDAAMRVSLPTFPQVSLTPQMFGFSWARETIMSESRSSPPDAPGSGQRRKETPTYERNAA